MVVLIGVIVIKKGANASIVARQAIESRIVQLIRLLGENKIPMALFSAPTPGSFASASVTAPCSIIGQNRLYALASR